MRTGRAERREPFGRADRWYRWGLAAATALLAVLSVLALVLAEPAETITPDLATLYGSMSPGQVLSLALLVVQWLLVVAAVLVAGWLLVTLADRSARGGSGAAARVIVRAAVALGVLGVVATSTAVVGFPVGLGLYSHAETIGVAPPAASMGTLVAVLSQGGLVLLSAAAVTGAAAPAVLWWCRRRSGRHVLPRALGHRHHGRPSRDHHDRRHP